MFKPGNRVRHTSNPHTEGTVVSASGKQVVVQWDDTDYQHDEDGSVCHADYLRHV